MTYNRRYIVIGLLALSAILLGSLVPGGPVENRDFSHITPGVLLTFNFFLTLLDLGSVVLMYFIFQGRSWAFTAAYYTAIAYFSVYAIDLAQLFPKTPSQMTECLAFIEVLGMTVAVPLMIYSRYIPTDVGITSAKKKPSRLAFYITSIALLASGISIISFATKAAMQSI